MTGLLHANRHIYLSLRFTENYTHLEVESKIHNRERQFWRYFFLAVSFDTVAKFPIEINYSK